MLDHRCTSIRHRAAVSSLDKGKATREGNLTSPQGRIEVNMRPWRKMIRVDSAPQFEFVKKTGSYRIDVTMEVDVKQR